MSYIKKALEESKEYFTKRYEKEVNENRKGDFTITILKNNKPVDDAKINYNLEKIDFDFGCNIFMIDQYDDINQQETYYKQWKNLFNTAVVSLYWGGVEPKQGYPRYDKTTPNDVYRRPPVDTVVNFCLENNIAMKGHPLFWHEYVPEWLPENWDELYPLIEKRFSEISSRYGDVIPVFDCVNEPSRIFDQHFERQHNHQKYVFPPEDYIKQMFALGKKYFPNNTLILNEATGATFGEFRGIYGGYYLLLEKLLKENVNIDRIGIQCHVWDDEYCKNVFHSERLYNLLDTYGSLGKPLVLSEIGLSCEDEEIQALATERLYRICFSHKSMSGIFWWNLDDNSILTERNKEAIGENLPYAGLVRNGRPKAAYKVLEKLIKEEWHTKGNTNSRDGKCLFNGFYGIYTLTINCDGDIKSFKVNFSKNEEHNIIINLDN
ncbi:MAG: endo-1,4-beta-xylanase [Bacilli bacterium]